MPPPASRLPPTISPPSPSSPNAAATTLASPRSPASPGAHPQAPLLSSPARKHAAAAAKAGDVSVTVKEERPRSTLVDRFLTEAHWSNVNLSGYFPDLYGGVRLNWVKAFGAFGETPCFSGSSYPRTFILWRLIALGVAVAIVYANVLYAIEKGATSTYYLYLTHWQIVAVVAYTAWAVVTALVIQINYPITVSARLNSVRIPASADPNTVGMGHEQLAQLAGLRCPRQMPLYAKINWMLWSVAFIYSLAVSIMFFGFVVPVVNPSSAPISEITTYYEHFGPVLIMLIDFCVGNIPFTLAQSVLVIPYMAAYVLFSIVAWKLDIPSVYCSPRCIYPYLEWNKPVQTTLLVVPLMLIIGPLITTIIWAILNKLKLYFDRHGGEPWIDLNDCEYDSLSMMPVPKPWYFAGAHDYVRVPTISYMPAKPGSSIRGAPSGVQQQKRPHARAGDDCNLWTRLEENRNFNGNSNSNSNNNFQGAVGGP